MGVNAFVDLIESTRCTKATIQWKRNGSYGMRNEMDVRDNRRHSYIGGQRRLLFKPAREGDAPIGGWNLTASKIKRAPETKKKKKHEVPIEDGDTLFFPEFEDE